MTSKAEKKRRKKAKVAHPFDVAPVPRREANGQPDRKGKPRAASAMALDVRCRHRGAEPIIDRLKELQSEDRPHRPEVAAE